jgi:hypothetical protein
MGRGLRSAKSPASSNPNGLIRKTAPWVDRDCARISLLWLCLVHFAWSVRYNIFRRLQRVPHRWGRFFWPLADSRQATGKVSIAGTCICYAALPPAKAPKAAPRVGGPGAPLSVTGSFLFQ